MIALEIMSGRSWSSKCQWQRRKLDIALNRSRGREPTDREVRDYSITSSAVNRSVGGMVKPSALAVFKLITSSYFVGC